MNGPFLGIAGMQQHAKVKEQYRMVGELLNDAQLIQISDQINAFRANLEAFARNHPKEIREHAEFRMHFQQMCTLVGIDPLKSNKGFWGELLGVGDFYYELSVQLVEVCLATRPRNGGLISMVEMLETLENLRGTQAQPVTEYDVIRAIKKLSVLGKGFEILQIGVQKVIQSVPRELNPDHTIVLHAAEKTGFVSSSAMQRSHHWNDNRFSTIIETLLEEGLVWIDDPETWTDDLEMTTASLSLSDEGTLPIPRERLFWIPGLHVLSDTI